MINLKKWDGVGNKVYYLGKASKKNYKLGLLAQPKVGRCPEGV